MRLLTILVVTAFITACAGATLLDDVDARRIQATHFGGLALTKADSVLETSRALRKVSIMGRTTPYPAIILALLIAAGIIAWLTTRALRKAVERRADAEALLAEDIEKLHQLEKLESIRLLVGGAAHDFGNLLTAILGQAELLLQQATDENTRSGLTEISEAGQQAALLARQLLDHRPPQPAGLHVVDVNALIEDTEDLLTRVIGKNIDLAIDYGKNVAPVELDAARLQLVVVSLAANARDSMPDGGKLSITTETVAAGNPGDDSGGIYAGQYTRIRVSDTGVGMDEKTLEHIFEPFFKAQPMGRGTSFSLSTVGGILKGAGGHVDVRSDPGKGSRFDALLPASEKQPTISSLDSVSGAGNPGSGPI